MEVLPLTLKKPGFLPQVVNTSYFQVKIKALHNNIIGNILQRFILYWEEDSLDDLAQQSATYNPWARSDLQRGWIQPRKV